MNSHLLCLPPDWEIFFLLSSIIQILWINWCWHNTHQGYTAIMPTFVKFSVHALTFTQLIYKWCLIRSVGDLLAITIALMPVCFSFPDFRPLSMSVKHASVHAKWIIGRVIGTKMCKTAKVRVTRLVLDPYLLKVKFYLRTSTANEV